MNNIFIMEFSPFLRHCSQHWSDPDTGIVQGYLFTIIIFHKRYSFADGHFLYFSPAM
jgi:hypothetical protein